MEKNINIFTDKASIKTIDRRRILYLIISILSFILTEIGRNIYIPFIYAHKINDYGIADSIGNSGGIIVQIFFMLTLLNSPKKKAFRLIWFIVIGYIIYEILQPYLARGVFDWKDIYGTLVGACIAIFILFLIKKYAKNKVVHIIK